MNRQFLSFSLQDTLYAVEVSQVQEVLEYAQPVRLPCTANYVEGLINSRGEGISVINLRTKFDLEQTEHDKNTRIIVLEVSHSGGAAERVTTFGAIADSVEEVIELDDKSIEPAPKFGNSIAGEFIRGIGKKDDRFIIILDVDKIFSEEEAASLHVS